MQRPRSGPMVKAGACDECSRAAVPNAALDIAALETFPFDVRYLLIENREPGRREH